MDLLRLSQTLVIFLLIDQGYQHKEKHQVYCDVIALDPNFEPEMVVGCVWNIFYSWNMNMSTQCMQLEFRVATHKIVSRIWQYMNEYLESQPYWLAATLTITMGSSNQEMLLLADQGPAGRFTGVPNIVRDSNIIPVKKSVPLQKIQLKVLPKGKYLLLSDCVIGMTALACRCTEPNVTEIDEIVKNLHYGEGSYACT